MTVSQWTYNRLAASSNVTSITSNITPNYIDYSKIPAVCYEHVGFKRNGSFRSEVKSIKCVETTQDKCETLSGYIYTLFDGTSSRIYGMSSQMKVESIDIEAFQPSVWDSENRNWFGVLDIRVNYII